MSKPDPWCARGTLLLRRRGQPFAIFPKCASGYFGSDFRSPRTRQIDRHNRILRQKTIAMMDDGTFVRQIEREREVRFRNQQPIARMNAIGLQID